MNDAPSAVGPDGIARTSTVTEQPAHNDDSDPFGVASDVDSGYRQVAMSTRTEQASFSGVLTYIGIDHTPHPQYEASKTPQSLTTASTAPFDPLTHLATSPNPLATDSDTSARYAVRSPSIDIDIFSMSPIISASPAPNSTCSAPLPIYPSVSTFKPYVTDDPRELFGSPTTVSSSPPQSPSSFSFSPIGRPIPRPRGQEAGPIDPADGSFSTDITSPATSIQSPLDDHWKGKGKAVEEYPEAPTETDLELDFDVHPDFTIPPLLISSPRTFDWEAYHRDLLAAQTGASTSSGSAPAALTLRLNAPESPHQPTDVVQATRPFPLVTRQPSPTPPLHPPQRSTPSENMASPRRRPNLSLSTRTASFSSALSLPAPPSTAESITSSAPSLHSKQSFQSAHSTRSSTGSSKSVAGRSVTAALRGTLKLHKPATGVPSIFSRGSKLFGSRRRTKEAGGGAAEAIPGTHPDPGLQSDDRGALESAKPSPANPWLEDKAATGFVPDGPLEPPEPRDNIEIQSRPEGKKRAYSSPLPFTYPFENEEFSNAATSEAEGDLSDTFSTRLPRELCLITLAWLVTFHEEDHALRLAEGRWNVESATRERWVGREKGMRELVKFSRVSKAWQSLTLDGQLWASLDLAAFPNLSPSLLLRLGRTAGPFVQNLNLRGHTRLTSSSVFSLTSAISLLPIDTHFSGADTQLTTLNLQFCTALTTRAIHHLLIRSPCIQTARLRGLTCVTNSTCDILAKYCQQLRALDVSRCPNMDATGIAGLVTGLPNPTLVELRAAGLKRVREETLRALAAHAPHLTILNLSSARDLTDAALRAFVAWDPAYATHSKEVVLTSQQMGLDPGDPSKHAKRVTRLRHLSLSSCRLLTDGACAHLAFAVPHLEFLEMADIGANVKDTGLLRLLQTTPHIARLDFEDMCDITDAVLHTLTPPPPSQLEGSREAAVPMPGQALEQLTLSYATTITSDAMLALVRGCERLRVLEVDNTRVSSAVVKEFVKLSKLRMESSPPLAPGERGAEIVAIDCRSVSESAVKEMMPLTRPRRGWRSWEARQLYYEDGASPGGSVRDAGAALGQDECDERRVVLKSFWSWQLVDAVGAARRRASAATTSGGRKARERSVSDDYSLSPGDSLSRATWLSQWSLTRRSGSGSSSSGSTSPSGVRSPVMETTLQDGCIIM